MGGFKAHGPRLGSRLQGLGPAGRARRIVEPPIKAAAPFEPSEAVRETEAAPGRELAVRRGKGGRFERVSRSAGG
jgi:hypothetical protein